MAVIKTLTDLINNQNRYDHNKIMFFAMTDDESLVIANNDLIDVYWRFIYPYISVYHISETQREYYRYKPALLSSDIYGTPELAWLIMKINERDCPSKFVLKSTIKLIPEPNLAEIYDMVLTKSNTKLKTNWNTYLTKVD